MKIVDRDSVPEQSNPEVYALTIDYDGLDQLYITDLEYAIQSTLEEEPYSLTGVKINLKVEKE